MPPSCPKKAIIVADDHDLFRRGLISRINEEPDLEVVGEAANGKEAVLLAERIKPSLIIMDLLMPICTGLEAAKLITQKVPEAKILMLTISEEDDDLFEAIRCGIQGYLCKNVKPDQFIASIRSCLEGDFPLSPLMAGKLVHEFVEIHSRKFRQINTDNNLSNREKEVLFLVAAGYSNRRIAQELSISENTVRNHVHSIMNKLGLDNRVEMAVYATKTDFVG